MSIPSDLPRKEREKLLRRQAILDAASRIFAQKGFERATLDEIAEAAEFGKGTIYNYFSSKEELFFTLLEEGRQYFQELIQQALNRAETGHKKKSNAILMCVLSSFARMKIISKYSQSKCTSR
ncbi:MAG: TetR/AcrR family transcriptional regulator [candidate division KSB1 bacterium]|nr:TetR/AcrR family transcriptional regulator [candidate division KSB1 bacterium]